MSKTVRRSLSILPAALVGGLILVFGLAPDAATQQMAEYVGSDLCQDCHPDSWESYAGSFHYTLELEGAELAGCEACHGPGSLHVEGAGMEEPGFREAIISFTKESADEKSGQCLTCHAEMEAQQHYGTADHLSAGVACSDCHDSHQDVAIHAALRQTDPGLCFDCHGDKRGQFYLPFAHPVSENKGLMVCSDCHNPHGSTNLAQTLDPGNDTCTDCHAEKKGPWIFPHASVETDGCIVCHSPHGSTNQHLLNFAETRFNCLQCHTVTPSFHAIGNVKECTACHAQIHGSNLDPYFLR